MSKAQKGLMWFGDIARNLYQSILNEPSVSVVTAYFREADPRSGPPDARCE